MAKIIEFPVLSHEDKVADVIAKMTAAGVKGVDEAWAENWLRHQQEARTRHEEMIIAGMSKEERLTALADDLIDTLEKAPRRPGWKPPSEAKCRKQRERLVEEAKTDRVARLSLMIMDRMDARRGERGMSHGQ